MDLEQVQIFHKYNKLVLAGKAEPIICQRDAIPYVILVRLGKAYLQCYACDSVLDPGQRVFDQMQRVIKDNFDSVSE